MNIADIKAEFGAYYLNNGQNLARLFTLLNIKSVTDSILTPIKTDETVWRASKASIGRVLQPFQKAWTPIGEAEFTPLAIEQFKQKIDTQEYPDDLEATWLGFLAGEKTDRKTWPFVKWFVEVLLLPQATEDYELNEVYKGVYAAPTPGTAGAAGTAMNGIRKAINDNVAGGRITPINTGALSSDNKTLVQQFETFVDAINIRYQNIPMQLAVQPSVLRRFLKGYRELYGKDTDYKGSNGSVDFSNINLIGLPSMTGSNKIWCTPKGNAIHLSKRSQNKNAVELENVDRLLKMYSDWSSGVGFIIPEIVFTNDQDLV